MNIKSQSALIEVILVIIAFIIVLYVFFQIWVTSNLSGSILCKTGYTFASLATPLVNKVDTAANSVAQSAGIILGVMTAVLFAASLSHGDDVGAANVGKYFDGEDVLEEINQNGEETINSQQNNQQQPQEINQNGEETINSQQNNQQQPQIKLSQNQVDSMDEDIQQPSLARRVAKNFLQNLYEARYAYIGVGTILGGALAVEALTNDIAAAFQEPILNSLCPTKNIYINSESINKKILSNTLNPVAYKKFIEANSNMQQAIYVSTLIAKYVFETYGDTLGASVALTQPRKQYFLIIDYNSNIPITYKSIVCSLYEMKYDNQNLYNLTYKGVQQESFGYGINDEICNYLVGSNYNNLLFNSNGEPLLDAMLYYPSGSSDNGVIINNPGTYGVVIIYDGLGDILIYSVPIGTS